MCPVLAHFENMPINNATTDYPEPLVGVHSTGQGARDVSDKRGRNVARMCMGLEISDKRERNVASMCMGLEKVLCVRYSAGREASLLLVGIEPVPPPRTHATPCHHPCQPCGSSS
jgi:hypothetical protein